MFWIEDGCISFDALPEEVEKIHLPDIRQSVEYANREHRVICEQRRRNGFATLAEQSSERDEMLALQARVRGLIGAKAPLARACTGSGASGWTIALVTEPEPAIERSAGEPSTAAPSTPATESTMAAADDPLAEFEKRRNRWSKSRRAASQDKAEIMATTEVKVPDIGGVSVPVIEVLVKVGDTIKKEQGLAHARIGQGHDGSAVDGRGRRQGDQGQAR